MKIEMKKSVFVKGKIAEVEEQFKVPGEVSEKDAKYLLAMGHAVEVTEEAKDAKKPDPDGKKGK